jgi:phage tail-like protein
MDVNGLPFRLIAGAADFGLVETAIGARVAAHLALSESNGHLRLASEQPAPSGQEDETFARLMITRPSPVADRLGSFAWWNGDAGRIEASGFAPGSIEISLTSGGGPGAPSDLMLGEDDVLYVARGGAVLWHDLRARWPDAEARHAKLKADLLAPAPGGGGWAFDRTNRRLMRIRGMPLRFAELRGPDADRFAPVEPNRDPPRLAGVANSRIDDRFDAVALAGSAGGRLALLAWESGADAALLLFGENGLVEHGRLAGLRFPFGLAWVEDDRLAVLASEGAGPARQAYVYSVAGAHMAGRPLNPVGRIHRLLQPWHGGFCNSLSAVPRHLQAEPGDAAPRALRPLHALSGGQYAREGRVLIGPLDGAVVGCVWHRLYAEAALADGSAIDIQVRADDSPAEPAMPAGIDDPDWALHRILPHRRDDTPPGTPIAAWVPGGSEIPNAAPMLKCEARPDRAGLFTLLFQHGGRKVRRIVGRYLWIALTLRGDSQGSPELAALRAYAGRQSWRDTYLPAFYGETLSGSDAAAAGPATRHDFMERFLHAHEGALTELEGRIAGGWQVTDPATAPDPALPWLGQWIGIEPIKGEATSRMRQRLLAAAHTASLNGTQGGLLASLELATGGRLVAGGRIDPGKRVPAPGQLAIARSGDVAVRGLMLAMRSGGECVFLTGGAVTKGDIVVVEGFRLRRTFATILGADLADEDDPLTLGMAASGNSFVGDTLILGDTARDELLALYRPEIDAARGDTEAVAQFYARLAWRVIVLVRGVTDRAEFRRLSDIVDAEVPAHVEPQVHHARNPLIVGAASLVGLDTYLAEPEPFDRVRLGETVIGEGDFVAGSGALDSRADGPVPLAPIAHADGPAEVWVGNGFTLSALASRAAERARIESYVWMWDKES